MNSKSRLTGAILAVFWIFSNSAFCAEKSLYENKDKGFQLELPKGWTTRIDAIVDLHALPQEKANNAAVMPNIKVVVRDLPDGKTIDEICDLSQKQWAKSWKVESDKQVKTGHTPTRRLVLLQDVPFLKTKIVKAFAANSGKYYIVSCSDSPEHFDKSVPMFEKVLDSLVLK